MNLTAFQFEKLRETAFEVLAVNYRISRAEVVALNLFAESIHPYGVLRCLCGMPEDDPKKKQEPPPSPDGEQA